MLFNLKRYIYLHNDRYNSDIHSILTTSLQRYNDTNTYLTLDQFKQPSSSTYRNSI